MRKFSLADVLIYGYLGLLSLICLFPFYYVGIVSFADPIVLLNTPLYVLPTSVDFGSYRILIADGRIVNSAAVSVFVTVVGTLISLLVIVMAGYSLSKKVMPLRRFFMTMVLLAMFFGGQLIPYFIIIRNLGLINNIWVLILPILVDPFFVIIAKNYFLSVSQSLEESARIDGAHDYRILFQIVIPVSKPMIASIALFRAVAYWNEWWHAMLFINNQRQYPLQMMLREILASINAHLAESPIGALMIESRMPMNPQTVRMAAIMATALPIIIVYPFIQKYFAKGLMLGSVKE